MRGAPVAGERAIDVRGAVLASSFHECVHGWVVEVRVEVGGVERGFEGGAVDEELVGVASVREEMCWY